MNARNVLTPWQKIIRAPLFLGSIVFFVQLILILLISPEKTLFTKWIGLASHWDSVWYETIAKYGYFFGQLPFQVTDSSDIAFKHMSYVKSNMNFPPGYPYLARILFLVFNIEPKIALLIVSQGATYIFWCFFFYMARVFEFKKQIFATILIVCFPTSWYMYTGYSESVFILSGCLFLWFATKNKWVFSILSGMLMTATRIIGVPVLIAPLLAKIFANSRKLKQQFQEKHLNLYEYKGVFACFLFGSLGFILFLVYSAYLSSWHLYFDVYKAISHGNNNPYFLLKIQTWLPPPFGYNIDYLPPLPYVPFDFLNYKFFRLASYTFSETLVPLFLWFFIFYGIIILKKRLFTNQKGMTWFFAALFSYFFACLAKYSLVYDCMCRYLLPIWIFLLICDMMLNGQILFRFTKFIWFKILIAGFIFISFGYWYQLLSRFCLNWWVS